jgi:hypothetical protein
MQRKTAWRACAPMLLLLTALLCACATSMPPPSPAAVPPLPKEARQPPTPPLCSPSCSEALRIELERLHSLLTSVAPPEPPASERR